MATTATQSVCPVERKIKVASLFLTIATATTKCCVNEYVGSNNNKWLKKILIFIFFISAFRLLVTKIAKDNATNHCALHLQTKNNNDSNCEGAGDDDNNKNIYKMSFYLSSATVLVCINTCMC